MVYSLVNIKCGTCACVLSVKTGENETMKYQQSKGVVFSWTKVGQLLEKSQITEKAD